MLRLIQAPIAAIATALAALAAFAQPAEETGRRTVLVVDINGVIGPATARHVAQGAEEAGARGAQALILRIDTPGGLSTSTREIIEEILAAPVPVIGYVWPAGGHAASAGTYILYATHVAAMAPGTNVGAATPVQIGGVPGLPSEPADPGRPPNGAEDGAEDSAEDGDAAEPSVIPPPSDTGSRKAINDAVAQIRSLAELRGRNAAWAERAVREAATLTAQGALEEGVVEFVAPDIDALLAAVDGTVVEAGGAERTLQTEGAAVEVLEPGVITQALAILANPNVALILMLIGVYGLIFEFANPGTIGPGVFGAIALVLGLYALNQLPLNYAGLALIALGVAFIVAEAFTPASGVLGIGGVIAFLIGSAMLIDTDVPEYQLSWWVVGVTAAVTAAFILYVLSTVMRTYSRRPSSGAESLLSREVDVVDWSGGTGHVWVAGERWNARGAEGLTPGQKVRITRVNNLELEVAPVDGAAGRGSSGKSGAS